MTYMDELLQHLLAIKGNVVTCEIHSSFSLKHFLGRVEKIDVEPDSHVNVIGESDSITVWLEDYDTLYLEADLEDDEIDAPEGTEFLFKIKMRDGAGLWLYARHDG